MKITYDQNGNTAYTRSESPLRMPSFEARDAFQSHTFIRLQDSYLKRVNDWYDRDDVQEQYSDPLREEHMSMAAMLAAMDKMAENENFALDPLKVETNRWLQNRFGVDFHLSEGFRHLANIEDSEVQKIDLSERWRICGIDFGPIRTLEASPLASRLEKLKPLIFDSVDVELRTTDKYFYNMAHGWKISMEDVHKPIDVPFSDNLNAVCSDSSVFSSQPAPPVSYGLSYGSNLTEKGLEEFSRFSQAVDARYSGLPIFTFEKADEYDGYEVFRRPVADKISEGFTKDLLAEHYKRQSAGDDQSADIDTCQKLNRFHRYKDGMTRTTVTLLLNRLRRAKNKSLLFYDDPNIFDGFSVAEIRSHNPTLPAALQVIRPRSPGPS